MRINREIIFKELINKYGFNVNEIEINSHNTEWVAQKEDRNGIIYVVYNSDKDEYELKKALINYANNKNIPFIIYSIVETKKNFSDDFSFDDEHYYKKIYYNRIKGSVVKYEAGSEMVLNVMKSFQNDKKSKAKIDIPSKVTLFLIAVNIIVFLYSAYLSRSIEDIDGRVLVYLGAKVNFLIQNGEYYRLFTAMFLHGGITHLLFNMYALYSIGDFVEKTFGTVKFLIIYFISGLSSSYMSYIFSDSISVGASGAIFGLLGASLVFAIKEKHRMGREFLLNISFLILFNIVIGLQSVQIDNFGHFGGLISGFLITYILYLSKKN